MNKGLSVSIRRELLDFFMENARYLHPRETLLLLRGKTDKNVISVTDLLVPPLATYGRGFSSFSPATLPIDFSIVGTAHSHPSGSLKPSIKDLNQAFGRIIMITAYPYRSEADVAVYDRNGNRLVLQVK